MKSIPVVGGLPRGYSLRGAILVAAVLGLLATLALGLVGAKPASAQVVASSQAAFFDESTDTIQVSGQTVIGTTSTYEAVISLSSAPDRQSLVFNEWTASAEDKQFQAGPSRLMGYNYTGSAVVADSPTLSVDTWHHVAYVYDGTQQRLYLDGILVKSQAAGGEVGDGSGLAHIGAIFRDGRINTGFVGYIDSLRISDVARYSGASFTPLSGDMTSDADTQLLYNFNDPEGSTTVQDSGPLGRTGTLGAGFGGATSPQLGAIAPQDQDTTEPTVSLSAPTNSTTVRGLVPFEATASDDTGVSKVEFYVDNALVNTDTTGPYQYSWDSSSGSDGQKTVIARAYDAAGNHTDSSPVTVTVDNTNPAPPSKPDLAASSDTGASTTDNLTKDTTPTFTGTAEANSTVELFEGTASRATAPVSASGTWSVTLTGVTNGRHTYTATATDRAGNTSAASVAQTVTVDTIKPTISGMYPRHTSIIRDKTPTIKATVKDNLTNLQKANIKLYVNNVLISPTKYSYSASTDLLTYNSPRLAKGKKTVKIVATDAAGNVGIKSWYFTIK